MVSDTDIGPGPTGTSDLIFFPCWKPDLFACLMLDNQTVTVVKGENS